MEYMIFFPERERDFSNSSYIFSSNELFSNTNEPLPNKVYVTFILNTDKNFYSLSLNSVQEWNLRANLP